MGAKGNMKQQHKMVQFIENTWVQRLCKEKKIIKEASVRSREMENANDDEEVSTLVALVTAFPIETLSCAVAFTILDVILLAICYYGLPDLSQFSVCNLPVMSLICMF